MDATLFIDMDVFSSELKNLSMLRACPEGTRYRAILKY